MTGRRLAVLLLGVACAAPAPPTDHPADAVPVTITPIALDGTYSGLEEPLREVVRSDEEWRALWARLVAGRIPRPDAPPIDFSEQVVVVAAMGSRPTGGYAIRIDRASYAGDTLWIEVTSVSPGAGCVTTQALSAPVAAGAVERRGEISARFLDREETLDCE